MTRVGRGDERGEGELEEGGEAREERDVPPCERGREVEAGELGDQDASDDRQLMKDTCGEQSKESTAARPAARGCRWAVGGNAGRVVEMRSELTDASSDLLGRDQRQRGRHDAHGKCSADSNESPADKHCPQADSECLDEPPEERDERADEQRVLDVEQRKDRRGEDDPEETAKRVGRWRVRTGVGGISGWGRRGRAQR